MKTRQLWLKVLLILLPIVLGLEVICSVSIVSTMTPAKADFRQLYVAGYMVRTGDAARLYDYDSQLRLQNALIAPARIALPYIRPAYQALLLAPLSLVAFRAAYFLWMAINIALVALSCYLLGSRFPKLARVWKPLPVAVLCAFTPVWVAVFQGQDTVFLLVLLAGAFRALEEDRDALAGCLLALGLFKFQIVLPIAFLFVAWKQWKFAKGFFVTALALAGISIALIGIPGIAAFFNSVIHVHYPVRYVMMSNFHALLVGLFGDSFPVTLATLALSAAAWLAVAGWGPVKSGPNALMLAIPTAALVSYYLFIHDWSVLALPLLFILDTGMDRPKAGWAGLLLFAAPLIALLALAHAFLTTIPMALLFVAVAGSTRMPAATPDSAEIAAAEPKLAAHV